LEGIGAVVSTDLVGTSASIDRVGCPAGKENAMSAVPKFIGKVTKNVFNPREIRKGKRPVLIHHGRTSGREYLTPLDAHRVDGGFIFIVMYGSDCDWVQNILAEENSVLRVDGSELPLTNPRLIDIDEAGDAFLSLDPVPKLRAKAEYLRMDLEVTDAD
jgi:hypothetical protein